MNHNATVLLVEDNPDEAELSRLALSRCAPGHEVVHVSDGVAALDYLLRQGPHQGRTTPDPVLVLLDLKMPVLDGFGVLTTAKASLATKHIPVVMLTSSTEPTDVRRAYAAGVNAYLAKPTDFGEFVQAMKHLCTYWLTVNQGPPRSV